MLGLPGLGFLAGSLLISAAVTSKASPKAFRPADFSTVPRADVRVPARVTSAPQVPTLVLGKNGFQNLCVRNVGFSIKNHD